jgi:streptogramin lyase
MINPATDAVTSFPLPADYDFTGAITAGPGGDLWFIDAEINDHAATGFDIASLDPRTGVISEFAVPFSGAYLQGITAGPDGNIWFTDWNNSAIGMFNVTTDAMSEFPVPTNMAGLTAITAGPDGNLWFIEQDADRIGMINPATDVITEYSLPTPNANPESIIAGPDGNIWFTELFADQIGEINPTTDAITEIRLSGEEQAPDGGMTVGPDGNIYFSLGAPPQAGAAIGILNPATLAINETPVPNFGTLGGITTGPDGNVWFCADGIWVGIQSTAPDLGYLTPGPSLAVTAQPPSEVAVDSPFGLTVTVDSQPGLPDASFNGDVTVALSSNPGDATLGGTLTVQAVNGVATFSGLSLDQAGNGYQFVVSTGPSTTASTAQLDVVQPPRQFVATITEIPGPVSDLAPSFLTIGPDGNLWFGDSEGTEIGMIDPSTYEVTTFALPPNFISNGPIAAGPDGDIWFVDQDTHDESELGFEIGWLDPKTGAISEFPLPSANAYPQGITAGPDGNIWFTDAGTRAIGMLNVATGAVSEFAVPEPAGAAGLPLPDGITVGPDGDLWFTDLGTGGIGTINPTTHAISEFLLGNAASDPVGITVGPGGNIWFTEQNGNVVGEISSTTDAISAIPLTGSEISPNFIAAGPDGNIYFTLGGFDGPAIGVIDPATLTVTEAPIPNFGTLSGIVAVPNGGIWFCAAQGIAGPDLGEMAFLTPIIASTDPSTTALTTPVEVVQPPTITDSSTTALTAPVDAVPAPKITSDRVLIAGSGAERHVVGFQLHFSEPLDASTASKAKNYEVTRLVRGGKRDIAVPVRVKVVYHAKKDRVDVLLKHRSSFFHGGKLVVSTLAESLSAETAYTITDIAHMTLAIGHNGKRILR